MPNDILMFIIGFSVGWWFMTAKTKRMKIFSFIVFIVLASLFEVLDL